MHMPAFTKTIVRLNEVDELSKTVADGFIHSYRDFARRVRALSENLSEEQFWRKPYPYGNSFGHLTLHLTGNLNYYIGAQIAQTGYVRDREREFREEAPPSKAEALRRLDEAFEAVGAADNVKDRFSIFLRCAAHFHHHVGQMIYLEKELSK
jgi:DinB superfamily